MMFEYIDVVGILNSITKDLEYMRKDGDFVVVLKGARPEIPDPNVLIDPKCMWIKTPSKNSRFIQSCNMLRLNLELTDEPIFYESVKTNPKGVTTVYEHRK